MTIQNDETLQMYLEESIEHLADIENDFLQIEADGAAINEELVNKVYRAAHSIKGGAGFMGLNTIKELTHEMENILGKIRGREIVPTSKIVNILLSAADTLKSLMGDILNSNDKDISDHLKAMQDVLKQNMSDSQIPSGVSGSDTGSVSDDTPGQATVALAFPNDGTFIIDPDPVTPFFEQGMRVYLINIRVGEDLLEKSKSFWSMIEEMRQTGTILSADFAIPTSDEADPQWVPSADSLHLLFASIIKPSDINLLFEIAPERILEVQPDFQLRTLDGLAVTPETYDAQPTAEAAPAPAEPPPITRKPQNFPLGTSSMDSEPLSNSTEAFTDPEARNESAEAGTADKRGKFEQETSLRVHVSLLDRLMTLAGELVLSRNQLLQAMLSTERRGSEVAGQRIDLITSELQEAIMQTRMQSIGNVFNKFPRVVRDLARSLGKNIDLVLEGKAVELDKTIIEAISDPLTHLVRNAVDHGIETPDVRQLMGKKERGQILLKAYHEAGQVNIEICDDGKGLDGAKLAAKAVEKGLISEEQSKVMSPREKTNLIFLPGFSTAERITDVSGRGVGMDVVKTNLDRLGGLIDINSVVGQGTTIRIKLPLTLAIIPCQIVIMGGERYAIPQVNLEELLRIPADQVRTRIERVGNAAVVRLRGSLLPLIRLSEIIGVEASYKDPLSGEIKTDRRKAIADRRSRVSPMLPPEESQDTSPDAAGDPLEPAHGAERRQVDRRYHADSALNIVVVSTGAMKYGLVVDSLLDSEEIVVKPLGRDLKKCKGYAGATIMGDGRVALILDVSNLARMAGLTSVDNTTRAVEIAESEHENISQNRDKQSLLLFHGTEDEQFAAPLGLVERIEKINKSDIEQVGGKLVIKYRGGALPLFSIDQVAQVKPLPDSDKILVIVFTVAGREIGLLAAGPVDALESTLTIDGRTLRQTGIMGSAIINNATTLLVDIVEIVQALNPHWFSEKPMISVSNEDAATILFAEDSSFFRNHVKNSMEKEGFRVLEAEDGEVAWDLLQAKAEQISLVVTDIEMPHLDGFSLAQRIKSNPAYAHLPVIALTTLAGENEIQKGKSVGIDDYQIKLDGEKLIKSIYGFLKAA